MAAPREVRVGASRSRWAALCVPDFGRYCTTLHLPILVPSGVCCASRASRHTVASGRRRRRRRCRCCHRRAAPRSQRTNAGFTDEVAGYAAYLRRAVKWDSLWLQLYLVRDKAFCQSVRSQWRCDSALKSIGTHLECPKESKRSACRATKPKSTICSRSLPFSNTTRLLTRRIKTKLKVRLS